MRARAHTRTCLTALYHYKINGDNFKRPIAKIRHYFYGRRTDSSNDHILTDTFYESTNLLAAIYKTYTHTHIKFTVFVITCKWLHLYVNVRGKVRFLCNKNII